MENFPLAIAGGFSKDIFTNPNMALLKKNPNVVCWRIFPFSSMIFPDVLSPPSIEDVQLPRLITGG